MPLRTEILLFTALLLAGILVRTAHYPHIPAGFNQDEAASAYESYSLLKTGKDKWGNPYPVYFTGFGAGMNVLQSYLTIPVIKAFGLNIFSARLIALILGCLTLPLVYFTLRPVNKIAAMAALFFVAFAPWHWMLSRWSLESNLLPFFLLLGVFTFSRAIRKPVPGRIVPALLPFAVALYAYGTAAVVVPMLLAGLGIVFFKNIREKRRWWLISVFVFAVAALPFGLFFFENYVVKDRIAGLQDFFPFSWAMVGDVRIAGNAASDGPALQTNLVFLLSGFNDFTVYNRNPGFPVIWLIVLLLFPVGLFGIFRSYFSKASRDVTASLAFIQVVWLLAAFALFLVFVLNINRANAVFLPVILIAALGFAYVHERIPASPWRWAWAAAVFVPLFISVFLFGKDYFTVYNDKIKTDFNEGLQGAFHRIQKLNTSQVLVTDQMPLPYVYTLFYTQYDPATFQKEVQFEMNGPYYVVQRFGKYVFDEKFLDRSKPFAYLLRTGEGFHLEGFQKQPVENYGDFEVGIFTPNPSGVK